MIKRLVFGGSVIESIPANVGLAILRVFVGLSMALGHGLGKIPPSERFVGVIENLGFPCPSFLPGWQPFRSLAAGYCWHWDYSRDQGRF